jgi:6-phosphofructokinase 1
VEALDRGETGVLVGQIASKITTTPLEDIVGKTKGLDMELVRLAKMLD